LSNIREPWLAWRQKRPEIKIRVIDAAGQPHMLDEAVLADAGMPGAQDVFTDIKFVQGPLPAVAPGAIIEAEYIVADQESVMPGERFDKFRATHANPVHHLELSIDSAEPVHALARGFGWNNEIPVKRVDSFKNGRQLIQFEVWDLPKFKPEPLLPPDAPSGPEIEFSTAESWQSVAAWYASLIDPFTRPDNLTPPPRTADVVISTAAALLANIQAHVRYTGVEFGLNAYVPRKPDEIFARGFGDCKEKATLLAYELRSHGIPARLALLSPFPFEDVLPELPGLEDFNHVIVYVPGDHPLWIDATDQYAPVMRLPVADQGRLALVVDPRTTALVRTPIDNAEDNLSTEDITVTLEPHGKAKISGIERERGGVEDSLRLIAATIARSPETKRMVDDTLKRALRYDKLTTFETSPPNDFSKPFELKFQAEGSSMGDTQGSTATADVPAGIKLLGAMAQLANIDSKDEDKIDVTELKSTRKLDYYVPSGESHREVYTVVPPPGFRPKNVPELRPVDLGVVKLDRSVVIRPDNSIVVTASYGWTKNRFTVAEVEQFAKAYKQLENSASLRLEFIDSTKDLITAGKDREALQLARQRTESAPQSASAWSGLAATLSSLGANNEAIDAARKATVLDPKSAQAFAQLAEAYSRDPFGRQFRVGMQLDRAIEAAREACQLDPEDVSLAVSLAQLQEYDDLGVRFSKRAPLPDAIATLRKVEDDLDQSGRGNVLAAALYYNRDFAAVKSFYAKDHGEAPESVRIAAVAASDGAGAAIEALEHSSTRQAHETVLNDAALLLISTADYPAAAALLREWAKQKGDDGSEESGLELLSQTRGYDHARYSDDKRIATVQRLMYALGGADETSARPRFDPMWRDLNFKLARNQMFNLIGGYRTIAGRTLTIGAWLDVAVSNAVFTVEGSDASGYRVRIADPTANGAQKTIAWMVRAGEEYQVLGMGPDLAPPGLRVLELIRKGDDKGARQWFDWVREEKRAPAVVDPLVEAAYPKIWPVGDLSLADIAVAAASIAVRGKHFEDALEVLQRARASETDHVRLDALDLALAQGAVGNLRGRDALEPARRLFAAFPDSDEAFGLLVTALTAADHTDEGLELTNARLAKHPDSAVALRRLVVVLTYQHKYAEAVSAARKLAGNPKAIANDWNQLAWISLFAEPGIPPDLEAAQKAVQLTQNRNYSYIHTLGCAHARAGDTAAARKELTRYLDSLGYSQADDAARLLHGTILEHVGLSGAARSEYESIKEPERSEPLSSYALARLRLAAMKSAREQPVQRTEVR
jgi:tetratricopeptide (TPR) repeat protein